MIIFTQLLTKIFPMYLLIGLGFIAGRTKKINSDAVAALLIYFLIPVVIFFGVLSTPLDISRIAVPFYTFGFCTLIAFAFRAVGKKSLTPTQFGIWSYACGSGNSGYFGIPLTYFLLGADHVGLTILAALGFVIYENTFGFYFVARAHHTFEESMKKLLELPTIWAFILAVILQKSGVVMNATMADIYQSFRSTYSVLGMILLGLGIAQIRKLEIPWKVLMRVFVFKFALWPALMFAVLILNKNVLHFFDPMVVRVLFLISLIPLPANAVAFSTALKTDPEQTALMVFLSTLFALFFIPAVWSQNFLSATNP